jgi:DNA-binding IclR family transcriptional regulator
MKRPKSDYSIQTVANALTLLESFQAEEDLGVTELSRRLGLHKNNVFRLLATLEERGYVEQVATTDRYRLAVRCLELGQAFTRSRSLLREAQPVIDALARELGESAHLAVLSGFEVVHLAGGQPDQMLMAGLRIGRRLPAHCTALGKALLGGAGEFALEAYDRDVVSRGALLARTPRTLVDREKLFEHLRTVASQGFALDLGEYEDGVACAAAAVHDATGRPVAALSVSGPAIRLDEDDLLRRVAPAVAAAADRLSLQLGRGH